MVELIQNTVDPMKQCSVLRVRTCLDSRQRLIRNFVEVELSHVGPPPSMPQVQRPSRWEGLCAIGPTSSQPHQIGHDALAETRCGGRAVTVLRAPQIAAGGVVVPRLSSSCRA